jgi:hypothetical protein
VHEELLSDGAAAPSITTLAGAPVLTGALSAPTGEKEYSQLKISKIIVAWGLPYARWDSNLPKLYTWMLEEGRTSTV